MKLACNDTVNTLLVRIQGVISECVILTLVLGYTSGKGNFHRTNLTRERDETTTTKSKRTVHNDARKNIKFS